MCNIQYIYNQLYYISRRSSITDCINPVPDIANKPVPISDCILHIDNSLIAILMTSVMALLKWLLLIKAVIANDRLRVMLI